MRNATMLLILSCLTGCTQYHLTVYKTVIAMPGSAVEMNSLTEATGNTSNPTTTAEPSIDATIPLVP